MEPVEVLIECPKCGAWMKLVRPKPDDDWEAFYGCTQWPGCRGSRELTRLGEPVSDAELREQADIMAEVKWRKENGKVGVRPDNQDVVGVASEKGRSRLTVSERNRRHDELVARANNNASIRKATPLRLRHTSGAGRRKESRWARLISWLRR